MVCSHFWEHGLIDHWTSSRVLGHVGEEWGHGIQLAHRRRFAGADEAFWLVLIHQRVAGTTSNGG